MLFVQVLSKEVFIANTPRIRPDAMSRLAQIPVRFLTNTVRFIASSLPTGGKEKVRNTAKFGKSVFAETTTAGSVTTLDMNNMKLTVVWVETKKGNRVPVFVPEGQTPSEAYIEYIKNEY